MKQENAPAYPALPAHNYKVNDVLLWDEASMKEYLDTWRKGVEADQSTERAQALAWRTVYDTLTDVYPDCYQLAATGMECATKAIRNLAARAGEKASFVTPSGELKPDVQVHASKVQAELGDCALNLCDPNGPHEKGCYLVQAELDGCTVIYVSKDRQLTRWRTQAQEKEQ